ncbi:tyrosine-protein phosphatase non-receptor type 1-like isoform X1 [Lethenteron reissneri]|uniref:tyrosine-protein phosphatase non-receptor type 1-like isoform X1 n=2 Tax=Lethenteron reissneri TaxID=7753 RepID=UPI002AB7268F|nr:tyrosine-protein phosphatase non-receptor type 1-like isoform X1 [Lethenteron reissneri]
MEEAFRAIERGQGGWERAFQDLARDSSNFSCRVAHLPLNRTLNRYRDVSPYDDSRVKLQRGDNDYINASLVCVPQAGRKYILTQGPLPHTCGHFWQMVWEQGSRAVVMLNRLVENNSIKCERYWPLPDHPEMIFDDTGVRVVLRRERERQSFTMRRLELEFLPSGERREVLQFHYTAWPDFGVPSSPARFRAFLQAVRASGVLHSGHGPTVVHCSAGIGRSGSFCLVDACLALLSERGEVDVRAELLSMRRARMGLIQTADQLRFSYLALLGEDAHSQDDDKDSDAEDEDTEMLRLTPLPPPPNTPPLPPPRRSLEPTSPPFFPATPEGKANPPALPDRPLTGPASGMLVDGCVNGQSDGPGDAREEVEAGDGSQGDAQIGRRGEPPVGELADERAKPRTDDCVDAPRDSRTNGRADGRDELPPPPADSDLEGDADNGREEVRAGEGEAGREDAAGDVHADGGGGVRADGLGDVDGKPRLRAVGQAERRVENQRADGVFADGPNGNLVRQVDGTPQVRGRRAAPYPLLYQLAAVILPALLFVAYRALFGERR